MTLRVFGMWLLTIAGAVGTVVEDVSWHVQPLIFYPSLVALVVGVLLLRTIYPVWLWRPR